MLIGCDGIWETMETKDICQVIKKDFQGKKSIDKIVEDLLDKLIAKETIDGVGCDNMSAVLVRFKN